MSSLRIRYRPGLRGYPGFLFLLIGGGLVLGLLMVFVLLANNGSRGAAGMALACIVLFFYLVKTIVLLCLHRSRLRERFIAIADDRILVPTDPEGHHWADVRVDTIRQPRQSVFRNVGGSYLTGRTSHGVIAFDAESAEPKGELVTIVLNRDWLNEADEAVLQKLALPSPASTVPGAPSAEVPVDAHPQTDLRSERRSADTPTPAPGPKSEQAISVLEGQRGDELEAAKMIGMLLVNVIGGGIAIMATLAGGIVALIGKPGSGGTATLMFVTGIGVLSGLYFWQRKK